MRSGTYTAGSPLLDSLPGRRPVLVLSANRLLSGKMLQGPGLDLVPLFFIFLIPLHDKNIDTIGSCFHDLPPLGVT